MTRVVVGRNKIKDNNDLYVGYSTTSFRDSKIVTSNIINWLSTCSKLPSKLNSLRPSFSVHQSNEIIFGTGRRQLPKCFKIWELLDSFMVFYL